MSKRGLLYGTAAFAVTFLVFLPVLGHEFVNWDDNLNFLSNPSYRGLGPAQIAWMFTTFHMGPYQPLAWLSLGLDYTLWGMDARGYHLTSLLLHAVNAGLFVFVAGALYRRALAGAAGGKNHREPSGRDRGKAGPPGKSSPPVSDPVPLAALCAALFFAGHPQRVESVAWVTERRDVVSGFFFLLALSAHLKSVESPDGPDRKRFSILALLAYLGSLLGKATGVTAPLVLLVLDVYPLRRFQGGPSRWLAPENRRLWLEKLPWLGLSLGFGIIAIIGQSRSGAFKAVETFGLMDRIGLTLYAAGFYLYKLVFPLGLSPLYEWTPAFDPFRFPALAISLLTVLAAAVLLATRRAWPAGLAAFVAFFVLIAPLSGAARVGNQLAADRYTYLATMPWALIGGTALLATCRFRPFLRVAAFLSIGGLACLTFAQAGIWRNSVSLWTQAVRVDPTSDRALMNLASAHVDAKQLNEAAAIYDARLAENPNHADARYSLGMVYYLAGEGERAEMEFRRLIADQPDFPMGHYGLGILFLDRGQKDEARTELELALKLAPGLSLARQALAQIAAQ